MLIPKFILTDVTDTSIKVNGQKMTLDYFKQVFVTMCLNASWNSFEVSRRLFDAMMNVNIIPRGYGKFSRDYADYRSEQEEQRAALQRFADEQAERMAAIHATPEEIAEDVAKRKARQAEVVARFRKASAGF
ncbi:hypothetical protein [Pseudescherichia sp.]|uniref:hypothetical protein n=1 Tax=Pseudescherichia sp. TaxID=2055881 RepID=UPI00289AE5A8|nr:hypothetical protein [Pseudescherichia sp.]